NESAVPGRAGPLLGIATQSPRCRIVDVHIQLGIVFDRLAALGIESLRPVQVIDVLSTLDELSGYAIQRIEKPVTAEMADDFAGLAANGEVVEHVEDRKSV